MMGQEKLDIKRCDPIVCKVNRYGATRLEIK